MDEEQLAISTLMAQYPAPGEDAKFVGKGAQSQKNPSQAAILIFFSYHPHFTIFFLVAR
jgi:hypothetical protein